MGTVINLESMLVSEALLYELHTLRTATVGYDETLLTINRVLNEARKLAISVLPKEKLEQLRVEIDLDYAC